MGRPSVYDVVEGLEAQKKGMERLMVGMDPMASTETHTFLHIRAAIKDLDRSIASFKAAHFNMFSEV